MPSPSASRAWLALAAAGAAAVVAAYVTGLGLSIGNSDEVLYAEFIRAMHRTGDYFTLRYHGAVHLQRPPLPFSLYALVSRLVPGEAGMRLLPALATAATALTVLVFAWRRFGRAAGITCMFLVAGVPTVYCYGRVLLSDPPFFLATTVALCATVRAQREPRFVAWAAAGLGAAFATKSLAAAIPAAGLAPWLLFAARRHRRSPRLRLGLACAWFLGLALPFYVISSLRFGRHFLDVHFGISLIGRARGQLEGIGMGGPLSYLRHLWAFDGPAMTIILLGGVIAAGAWAMARRDEELGVLATFALVCLVGLSAVQTRLSHYLLPFYPAAACCSGAMVERGASWIQSRLGWHARGELAALLGVALGAALFAVALAYPTVDGNLLPVEESEDLGRAAALEPTPGPAYSLDWYAPGFAYHADRAWRLLTTEARMARIVGAVDTYRDARTVSLVPPWPKGRFLVAGLRHRIERAPFRTIREIARVGEFELVEAEGPP